MRPEQVSAPPASSPERRAARGREGPIVTIDGPSGTGKSTLGRRLAEHFGWRYIDSGAMYRAVALLASEAGIPWTDEVALMRLARQLSFELALCEDAVLVRVNGRDVTPLIRSEATGAGASRVATLGGLRQVLIERQRELGEAGNIVMDGRDIGSIVFPWADMKFYLDATPESRAQRRWLELQKRGEETTLAEVMAAVQRRDHDDRTRTVSPLRIPDEAYYIDTTNLSIDDVLALMVDKVKFFGISFRAPHPRQGRRCPKST
jgi:cytidylate kinase